MVRYFGTHPFAQACGTVETTKRQTDQYLVTKNSEARVPSESIAVRSLPAWITIIRAALQALERFTMPPGKILVGCEHAIGDEAVGRVVLAFRYFDDLMRKFKGRLRSRPQGGCREKPEQNRDALQVRADALVEQLFRRRHCRERLRRGNAFQRHQRIRPGDQ